MIITVSFKYEISGRMVEKTVSTELSAQCYGSQEAELSHIVDTTRALINALRSPSQDPCQDPEMKVK